MWQDAGNRGIQGNLYEERPGLSHARHSCLQPAPAKLGIAEPCSQGGGTSGKACIQKGQKPLCSNCGRDEWEKHERNSPTSTKMRKSRRGGGGPGNGVDILLQPQVKAQWRRHPHCSLWKTPFWSKFILNNCSSWEGLTLVLLGTDHDPHASSCCSVWGEGGRGVSNKQMKLSLAKQIGQALL